MKIRFFFQIIIIIIKNIIIIKLLIKQRKGKKELNYFDLGIDFGSTSTKIFIKGGGIALNTNSVVAFKRETGELIEIGDRAYRMLGKTPDFVVVKSPILNGSVADYDLMQLFINEILARIFGSPIKKLRLLVSVHSAETEFEKFNLINSIFSCQNGEVFCVEEPIASGFGAGFDLDYSHGLFVVDIGGGTTDLAFIERRGVVHSFSLKIGGQAVDEAICENLLKNFGLIVGRLSAEKLKIQAANLLNCSNLKTFQIRGKDKLTGLPKRLFLSQNDIFGLIEHEVAHIVNEIGNIVCRVLCDATGFEGKTSILLTGGGSLIRGLPEYVQNKLKIETKIAVNPISCVICGLGRLFEGNYWKSCGFVQPA